MDECAVLFDAASIQKFVFGSNKLKENLGASHLIEQLYYDMIDKSLNNLLSIGPIPNSSTGKFKGYIGGGNALFYLNTEHDAKEFIFECTRFLLIHAPGVHLAAAYEKTNGNNYRAYIDKLFRMLNKNKFKYISQTTIPKHGITAEDKSTGLSMEVWVDNEGYISASTSAKIKYAKKANEDIEKQFTMELNNKFTFTDELDKLGQSKGSENHIAIVHIDGNGMGDRFKKCSELEGTIGLSNSVEKAVRGSFSHLLMEIVKDFGKKNYEKYLNIKKENNKQILPIRPIIMGGDDITFVCDGRLGIYYAKIFMEKFMSITAADGEMLSSCAGIAVIKTKFPFYRGYELAEQLCSNAKRIRKENGGEGSWLDFHYAYGGFSGSLEEIRNNHYQSSQGNLIFRPYKLNDNGDCGMETLIENAKELSKRKHDGKKGFPNNKLKELRKVLTQSESDSNYFVASLKARDVKLPEYSGKKYHQNLFDNEKTPYFDLIEFLDLYPKFELEKEAKIEDIQN